MKVGYAGQLALVAVEYAIIIGVERLRVNFTAVHHAL